MALQEFHDIYGYAPTVEELRGTVGLASKSTLHAHLVILRDASFITWVEGSPRTLTLTPGARGAIVER